MQQKMRLFLVVNFLFAIQALSAKDSILNVSYDPTREFYKATTSYSQSIGKRNQERKLKSINPMVVRVSKPVRSSMDSRQM